MATRVLSQRKICTSQMEDSWQIVVLPGHYVSIGELGWALGLVFHYRPPYDWAHLSHQRLPKKQHQLEDLPAKRKIPEPTRKMG